jgi:hypothetical protein
MSRNLWPPPWRQTQPEIGFRGLVEGACHPWRMNMRAGITAMTVNAVAAGIVASLYSGQRLEIASISVAGIDHGIKITVTR